MAPSVVGRKRMRFIGLGFEAPNSPGVPVSATTRWRGSGTIEDTRVVENIDEDIGIFGGADRDYISKYGGTVGLDSTAATFEQLMYLPALGYGGPRVGVKDGTGSGYVYNAPFPVSEVAGQNFATVEGGDDHERERVAYCFCTKFGLSGSTGKAVMIDGPNLMGRTVDVLDGTTGFVPTAVIPVPDVETIITSAGKVYLDDVTGAFGTTQVSQTILGFKINVQCSWEPNYTMDGSLAFAYPTLTDISVDGELTMKHTNASNGAQGEKKRWRNRVTRLLAIRIPGSALATPGAFTKKELQIDLPIKWKKFSALGEINGESTVTGTFESRYNPILGNRGGIKVVNSLPALP